jgi:hypothetical protein
VTRNTTPHHWPDGTPRSQHNAFTSWRIDLALGIDSIFARDYVNCSSLYNQWRSAQRPGGGKGHGVPWAQFRDANRPQARNYKDRHIGAPAAGFRANNGTIHGLSDKADAMIATQTQLMPITGSVWNGSKVVTPPHGGAYSKAVKAPTHGLPPHLARKAGTAKAKKVAA